MIYISSVAFGNITLKELVEQTNLYNLNVELSANIKYEKNVKYYLKKIKNNFLIHNYFPKPNVDFVLNLASTNETIKKLSIKHCIDNIRVCRQFGIKFFSVHSGFRFDPLPKQLGQEFTKYNLSSKHKALELFINSISCILNETKGSNVSLLLENNVLTAKNLNVFSENPLLCCTHDDYIKVLEVVKNHRLGVLVDYGHLKVTANTLNFSINTFYEELKNKIFLHHLSYNNSFEDQNKVFPNMNELTKIYDYLINCDCVLEIKNLNIENVLNQLNLFNKFIGGNEN